MKKSNPLPYLPERFKKTINWLKSIKIHPKIVFFVLGILSTLWFLIRVIPKPSRAAYPCMQATAPYMSAFVLWLTGIGGTAFSYIQFRKKVYESKYILAILFLSLMIPSFLLTQFASNNSSKASELVVHEDYFTPNEPIGQAKGIFPGRVVWNWNPLATNANCDNTSNNNGFIDEGDNGWFMEINNDLTVIDSMVSESLQALTGEQNDANAWDAIFMHYNEQNGNGSQTYNPDEIVLIKLNATTVYGAIGNRYYDDLGRNDDISVNPFSAETNPWLVLSILRQLVDKAGVPQGNIYIGDAARNIYKEFYQIWHEEFPEIHYLGNDVLHPDLDIAALGRTPVVVSEDDLVFYSDNGEVMPDAISDHLYTIYQDMDYLINIPTMKAHATAGITLAAKNHFGSFTRDWALHLHDGLMKNTDDPERLGYGLYRIQTDIMEHQLLGGKNLLMIVDGLYPGEDALGVPEKWQSEPFNNDWCSSIFMSLDPVAIESVCHDFLRTEYNGPTIAESRPNWHGVDDYLHQAADSNLWAEGVIYDPDNDGVLIASLGVHEHWNDSINKEYTRNLGIGDGIELVKAHDINIGIMELNAAEILSIFPNPATEFVQLKNLSKQLLYFQLIDMNGRQVSSGDIKAHSTKTLQIKSIPKGIYNLRFEDGEHQYTQKIIKQ